ncbi:hypothetical protein OG369_29715 [Streptomyces sp. NBC_01221]|uniref:hypothetical protein n=1 Tax=Streptomyces sp. NBC_01221 TaxID=2903782 RepID=UPI00225B575E|nr:hypothetical protein [Streptomyces sp. NBC_01221]MCX4790207.1 hypothetical protein [Streptomyces sp. NBC_01221]
MLVRGIFNGSGHRAGHISRLISRGPGGVSTLYLGASEITWTKATGKTTARRYYEPGGASTVRQDNGSLSFVVGDHHGTGELAIDATTQAMVQRRNTPFGEARGTVPPAGSRPGTEGFVGGTQDPTGLTLRPSKKFRYAVSRSRKDCWSTTAGTFRIVIPRLKVPLIARS